MFSVLAPKAKAEQTTPTQKPPARWVAAHSTRYTVANRENDLDIRWIVIHVTSPETPGLSDGGYAGTINYWSTTQGETSAHYIVKIDGSEITQMVRDKDIAYHAGNWPYNQHSIGIEIAGYTEVTLWSDPLYQMAGWLTRFLADEYSISLNHPVGIAPADPATSTGIIGHNQVPNPDDPTLPGGIHGKTDPGSTWDWSKFMSYVNDPFQPTFGWTTNPVPLGYAKIDFEEGTEGAVIKSTVPGLKFTTTLGYDWVYGDKRTGYYNVDPYGSRAYVTNGNFFAWLGIYMGQGRIDFIVGPASYFSVLTSTYSGLSVDAYDSNDNLIATSGWASNNIFTGKFTRLTIQQPGMAYVIIHDTGNYWLIDDLVTDAPAYQLITSPSIEKISQRFEISLITGDWTTPNSQIKIDIYDITMRVVGILTELTPQVADNLVGSFVAVLKDRNGDGKITPDEIQKNIAEQLPEEIMTAYLKFLIEQIYALNLPTPPPNYGENLLAQLTDFGSKIVSAAETYGPTIIEIVAIPFSIYYGYMTFGLGGYSAIPGIYIPISGLFGTDSGKMIVMYSHGDLQLIDSEGRIISKTLNQISGATYVEADLNGDGIPDDAIMLPAGLMDYTINVIPDPTASPSDTFTLTMVAEGIGFNLVKEQRFADAPELGFRLNSIPLPSDTIPPTTELAVGKPHYVDSLNNIYVTSATSFTLTATDNPGGTGVKATAYRIYNASYDTGWLQYTLPFYLTGLTDGLYDIAYNSTDNAGNIESTHTTMVILDNTPPSLTIETPSEGDALQYGVTFKVSAWDLSAVASVTFSIQCPQGNVVSPEFQSMPATLSPDGKWQLHFDTTKLPDGFYLFVANGTDVLGNWGTKTVQFSIRNWAALELLPASESNKAGRTMPIKFSLRVKATVDPARPFIWNEELTIKIYAKGSPGTILQTSTYGTIERDYRIDSLGELYITNFKTLTTPKTYVVEIYRKGMLIGTFQFSTVK